MTMYHVEQDALDAAIKYPYELSPQQMVDKLIELMIMTKELPCEHGNYARHIVSVRPCKVVCDGTPKEGT